MGYIKNKNSLVEFVTRIVEPDENGCWLWRGPPGDTGYGHGNGTSRSHRLAYEIFRGPIPEGLYVCHTCDVRLCVNPAHLFLGTAADNMRDKMQKGRGVAPKGSKNGIAKLNEEQVREIHSLVMAGHSRRSVGRRFNISHHVINSIMNGKTWRHVTEFLT